jgi:predicted enzyme involved in methoxymalonyl-ACP biosynthesis
MRKTLIEQDVPVGEKRRLIKRLWKVEKNCNFPEGLEFSYQYLYLEGERWIQIVRIDNQLHEGRPGTHVHIMDKEMVKWEDLSFDDAREEIMKIAEKIIKNIMGGAE